MAFDSSGFSKVSANYNAQDAGEIYSYKAPVDTMMTILVDGYFNPVAARLQEGDTLLIEDSLGVSYFARISQATLPVIIDPAGDEGFEVVGSGEVISGYDLNEGREYTVQWLNLGPLPDTTTAGLHIINPAGDFDPDKPVRFTMSGISATSVIPIPYSDGASFIEPRVNYNSGADLVQVIVVTNFNASIYDGIITLHHYRTS